MLARVYSCAGIGINRVVEIGIDSHGGFPKVTIIGLPDGAVQESHERVRILRIIFWNIRQ
jgi:magnesium chelatase family protein